MTSVVPSPNDGPPRLRGSAALRELRVAERDDLLAWAGPLAAKAGIRHVGLERKLYPYGRLLPFVRTGISFYERDAAGAWVRYRKARSARP